MVKNQNFTPFIGFVEDTKDPKKFGRVRVRVSGYHTDEKELPTDQLIWFHTVDNGSEALNQVGEFVKYNIGSMVFGYFIDAMLQNGFVVGAINGEDENEESDLSRLARNEKIDETIVQAKKDGVRENVETTSGNWSEPQTPYDTQYPDNRVRQTNSGHVIELDDTEGAERIHVYHKAGTFTEIHPQGSQVVKIVKDGYTIVSGDDFICIEGDVSKYIGGNDDLVVKGNQDAKVAGTRTWNVEGKDTLRAPQIQLGEDDAVEPSVLGDQLAKWIETELVPWLNTHQHIGNLSFPTSPPPNAPRGPFEPGEGAKGGGVYSKRNKNQ